MIGSKRKVHQATVAAAAGMPANRSILSRLEGPDKKILEVGTVNQQILRRLEAGRTGTT